VLAQWSLTIIRCDSSGEHIYDDVLLAEAEAEAVTAFTYLTGHSRRTKELSGLKK